jgi:hypothetical protein
LKKQIIDEFVNETMIRNNKIQFIFQKKLRVDTDSIVVLGGMKDLEKIIRRWWFDDDHVDDQIKNLLHKDSIKQKRWI